MARARNIKPGFFINDQLAEIEPLGRLLFAGLWTIADREGRLEDRPKKIKAEILPYDNCDVDILLSALHEAVFITRYTVNGCNYIQIINFSKHQNPHPKEATSIIPAIPSKEIEKQLTGNLLASDKTITKNADSLIPLILISDSPIPITTTSESLADKFEPEELENSSRQVFDAYEKEFGRLLSPTEIEILDLLAKEINPDLVIHALKQAVLRGKRQFSYIRGILSNWKCAGVKCIQDVEELEKQHDEQKKKAAAGGNDRASPKTYESKSKVVDQFFGLEGTGSG